MKPARTDRSAWKLAAVKERLSVRTEVMLNLALSPNARILYYLIDDLAGSKDAGMWWGWRKLAIRVGISKANFFRFVTELKEAGVLVVERRKKRIHYLPAKVSPARPLLSEESQQGDSTVSLVRLCDGPSLVYESVSNETEDDVDTETQETPSCYRCRDTGREILGKRGVCKCEAGNRLQRTGK
jgi:hypothetical protein